MQTVGELWGLHPLPGYLLLVLAASLVGGWLGWLNCLNWGRAPAAAAAAQPTVRPWGALLAFTAALLAASLFALIALQLGPHAGLSVADQALTDAIHAHTPAAALPWFARLTHLADPAWLVLLTAGIAAWLWQRQRRDLLLVWLVATGGNAILNPLLKGLFARARPIFDPLLTQASGFSFPSGHSSGAAVCYGMLWYIALCTLGRRRRLVASFVLPALIVAVAGSRVFLSVHFASDVWAGLLSGSAWTALCIGVFEWRQRATAERR
ncbi:MAG: phosphatase PAP2 family protein [Variovorax sp.]